MRFYCITDIAPYYADDYRSLKLIDSFYADIKASDYLSISVRNVKKASSSGWEWERDIGAVFRILSYKAPWRALGHNKYGNVRIKALNGQEFDLFGRKNANDNLPLSDELYQYLIDDLPPLDESYAETKGRNDHYGIMPFINQPGSESAVMAAIEQYNAQKAARIRYWQEVNRQKQEQEAAEKRQKQAQEEADLRRMRQADAEASKKLNSLF